eukprot:2765197-Pyramimonas_sp.AAC.1
MGTQRLTEIPRAIRPAGFPTARMMARRRPRRFAAVASQQDRRSAQSRAGLLSRTLIQPATLKRYRAAVA